MKILSEIKNTAQEIMHNYKIYVTWRENLMRNEITGDLLMSTMIPEFLKTFLKKKIKVGFFCIKKVFYHVLVFFELKNLF